MEQNAPPKIPRKKGWNSREIRAALVLADLDVDEIGRAKGLTGAAIRACIRGDRAGLRARQALADALGRKVTDIWPDALLPLRERRLRKAS